jgi:hypothetical protein
MEVAQASSSHRCHSREPSPIQVITEAVPRPLFRLIHQSSRHRIAMHDLKEMLAEEKRASEGKPKREPKPQK